MHVLAFFGVGGFVHLDEVEDVIELLLLRDVLSSVAARGEEVEKRGREEGK